MGEQTDTDRISRMANDLNNDVQLLATWFNLALDLLEQWIETYPDERHLVVTSRGLLARGGRDSTADRTEDEEDER